MTKGFYMDRILVGTGAEDQLNINAASIGISTSIAKLLMKRP